MANLYEFHVDENGNFVELISIYGSCETLHQTATEIFQKPDFQELLHKIAITPFTADKPVIQLAFDRFKMNIGGIAGYPETLTIDDIQVMGLQINDFINKSMFEKSLES